MPRRVVFAALVGCGRLGYDAQPRVDASPDAPVDGAMCPGESARIASDASVCIDLVERGDLPWTDAVVACGNLGRRLCTDAEWFTACVGAPGVIDMIDGGYEWVAEESGGVAQKRGSTECTITSNHVVTDPYEYRCCVDL